MPPTMDMPSDMMLFPPIPFPSTSRSRRVQQRQPYPAPMTVDLSNQVLTALNHMSVSLSSPDLLADLPSIANARQPLQQSTISRCHDRVYHACQRFRRHSSGDGNSTIDDSSIFNDLDKFDHNITDHGYSSPAPARMITAAKVSLPQQAGTADLLSVLPPHLQMVYSKPSLLLRPPAVKVVKRKAFMCSHSEYILLLKRMLDKNMISFTDTPLAVNGLFGVDKDGGESIRLIIDARPVNSMFVPSPPVSLPTPDLVASFDIPKGTTLYAAKVDLDNFYHRIRLPEAWWPYFALPAIRAADIGLSSYAADSLVYPCCKTLPMGFSHSVFLAQAAHEHVIDTRVPLLRRCDRIIRHLFDISTDTISIGDQRLPLCTSELDPPKGDLSISRLRHSVYIDDLNMYGTDPVMIDQAMDQYLVAMDLVHLPAKPSKIVRPTADGIECLGMFVHGRSSEVGMSVPKLQVLRASTMRLLDIGECTGRELSHLVGRWTWAMLVRRPAMAIFSAVYRFIECAHDSRFTLWPSVRRELWTISRIAPLLYSSINCEWSPVVIASDASEVGAGVVFTNTDSSIVGRLASLPTIPGTDTQPALQSFVTTANWKTAISHQWYHEEHINALEVRSSLAAVRWSMKRPDVLVPSSTSHSKLLLLVDSSATLGSINKGRSSSHRLLRPLRTISSLVLAAGIYLRLKWIPSAMNPADRPSRSKAKSTKE
jgi:hypothetical protein